MNKMKFFPHLLGSLLVLSTVYHSHTLYSLIVSLPFLLVSFNIHHEKERLLFPSLILAIILPTFFISAEPMYERFSLLIFSFTFALPMLFYWIVVLSPETNISWKGTSVALSYVLFTALLFYLLPELLPISEFILTFENRVLQILMFFGSGMMVSIPYQAILEFKS